MIRKSFIVSTLIFTAIFTGWYTIEVQAQPESLKNVERTVKQLYTTIEMSDKTPPDWRRFRSLFLEEAHLIHVTDTSYQKMTVEEFINAFKEQVEKGQLLSFHEYELDKAVDRYAHIAQVFSTYEAKFKTAKENFTVRGINSIQLLEKAGSWKIVSLIWYEADEETPVPPQYLPEGE